MIDVCIFDAEVVEIPKFFNEFYLHEMISFPFSPKSAFLVKFISKLHTRDFC